MSAFRIALRTASRTAVVPSRTFITSDSLANLTRDSAPSLTSTIRNVAENARAEASDEAFKAGVVYTLLGVSALGAGYLILAPKDGKTVMQKDLL